MGRPKKKAKTTHDLNKDVDKITITTEKHGTVTFYKVEEGERKSMIWSHFWRSEDGSKASCNICRSLMPSKGILSTHDGSTRGAMGHLKTSHPEVLERNKEQPRITNMMRRLPNPSSELDSKLARLATKSRLSFRQIAEDDEIRPLVVAKYGPYPTSRKQVRTRI